MNTASIATEPTDHTAAADWRARVAHAFSRAAPHYAQRATAQHAMGERLMAHLPARADSILDLGCGPGELTARLARHYPDHRRIEGLDLAPGMLDEARRRHPEPIRWVCADAGMLPHAAEAFDLVISNLAIQWCPDLDPVLDEIRRVLRPGGRALLNTLGPGTLHEVSQAWSHPERPAALLDFHDAPRYRRSARRAGFRRVAVEQRAERFHYPDLDAVMASIKGVGAQVARPGKRLTRADLARARHRYETLRESPGLPVTYHLVTLILER
ncbi:methyltransferase domain-containing protein [Halomonas elongata]|uniref:methyltransferase domain-containing protein n=1 Tax=Halomonas elongata TaxID=2746 RepID=UPI00186B9CC9|nr:methyltransferase domain-containing protein [Halomonas elongata]MBW5798735.1 methyltransferase domain-containing protein [Halomonas elongata]WVI72781.1 methyltransferase domain-containing protein [Halomonas elongata]